MNEQTTFYRASQRGSALILVLLILLALSAIGMVALQDVSRTVEQSGQYRVRSTAATFSDAVAQFMSKRIGDKAARIWSAMQQFQDMDRENNATSMSLRTQQVTRGAYIRFKQDPTASTPKTDFSGLLQNPNGFETGLFTDGKQVNRSFESREEDTNFEIIVRDPVDGIPVPGYSSRYCFKKVTVAARTEVGEFPTGGGWSQPRQIAAGRTVFEGLIGPLECGSQ